MEGAGLLIVETLVLLLLFAVALGWVARRAQVPYPIVLLIGGAALGFVPKLPQLPLDPQLLLVIVLPPVLYQAALFTSWRDFRAELRPISLLAFGLVAATTVAVAATLKWLVPDTPWAAAFVFGAIVSPPDAVAATAILSALNMPRRIVTILEGESLVNDAAGLVIYKFAVAVALTGMFSPVLALGQFVMVAAGGVGLGLLTGRVFVAIHMRLQDAMIEVLMSVVLPFFTYLLAETLQVSGVLAVVAAGLVRGRHAPEAFSPQARILAESLWSIIVFLLNSLVFILIGVQLRSILEALSGYSALQLGAYVAAVSAVAIVVRMLWVIPGAYLPRALSRRIRHRERRPPWRNVFVVGWCGMRGIVSLAAALALPYFIESGAAFPHRPLIIFLSFALIAVTLVLQGLTLAPLIRMLGIGTDWTALEEEREARLALARAALTEIDRLEESCGVPPEYIAHLQTEFRNRAEQASAHGLVMTTDHLAPLARLRLAAIGAERRELLRLWHADRIGDEVLHQLQRELDFDEARLPHP